MASSSAIGRIEVLDTRQHVVKKFLVRIYMHKYEDEEGLPDAERHEHDDVGRLLYSTLITHSTFSLIR